MPVRVLDVVKWGLGGVLVLGLCGHTLAQSPDGMPPVAADASSPLPSSRVPLDEIRRFVTLFNAVRDGYVDEVHDQTLMAWAIRGLLTGLDPHSVYLEKASAEEFADTASGSYGGIGIEVMYLPEGWIRVIAPIDDTPAARAGVRAGDVIIAVDGEPLVSPDGERRERLRGVPGTGMVLSVLRDGRSEPLEIEVVREVIHIISVRGKLLEPGYGYIRLSAFQMDTAGRFRDAVRELHDASGGALRGLVIDLRSNPGGLLTAAVQIADDLLETGSIVSTRGRLRVNDTEFVAWPRADHRQPHLRQRLGAEPVAAGQRRCGQAHHFALLHPERALDPGARHRPGRGAARGRERQTRCRRRRVSALRSHLARAPARRA